MASLWMVLLFSLDHSPIFWQYLTGVQQMYGELIIRPCSRRIADYHLHLCVAFGICRLLKIKHLPCVLSSVISRDSETITVVDQINARLCMYIHSSVQYIRMRLGL